MARNGWIWPGIDWTAKTGKELLDDYYDGKDDDYDDIENDDKESMGWPYDSFDCILLFLMLLFRYYFDASKAERLWKFIVVMNGH